MSEAYDYNPMPHKLDMQCPNCKAHASFEFGEVVKISLKKDIPFFQQSPLFEYMLLTDSCGHKWHGAFYFAGLHGGSVTSISELPEGYRRNMWEHSQYKRSNHQLDIGSFSCSSCKSQKFHYLNWPEDAHFQIEYKGKILWAYNRESCRELQSFIASNDRKENKYNWASFLLHIPSIFKSKKARELVSKKLTKALS